MDFLEKLDYLMDKNNLNKSTLSKACHIPYTTIDGWYKKGYEGLKLTTLKKLSLFFGTPLDYWAYDSVDPVCVLNKKQKEILHLFDQLEPNAQNYIISMCKETLKLQSGSRKESD